MFSFRDSLPELIVVAPLTFSSRITVDGHLKSMNRSVATRTDEQPVSSASRLIEDGKHALLVESVTVYGNTTL